MEKNRISIPIGALIACILAVVFLIAFVMGVTALIVGGLSRGERNANATEVPVVTDEPTPSPTAAPTAFTTYAPGETPSGSLIEGGTQVSADTDVTEMLAGCMSAVVSIDITMMQGSEDVYAGSGSGVLITKDGYIATCSHVVEGAAKIYVYLNDGSKYEGRLVGNDPVTDIAVVKLDVPGVTFPCATLGTSSTLRVGQTVYAIGNALGELSNTVTDGIISGLDRDIEVGGQSMTLLQTSAAINSGNSGGALFLGDGTLIGIVNAKSSGTTSSGTTIEGLGFAVPIDLAKSIIKDIMDYGFVTGRPYLGVSTKNVSFGYGLFTTYTYPQVVSVADQSPAALAGIRVNDIITAINGEAINSSTALRVKINSFNIGDKITVTVQRGNEVVNIEVTLAERTQK